MTAAPYRDEPLRDHDRTSFSCGIEPLDRYFREQVGQDKRRKVASPYVLVEAPTGSIVGFCTLSAFAIGPASLARDESRRLPRYTVYPVILIGRLAVDLRYRGQGLGRQLLAMALQRCLVLSEQIGAVGVVVNAKDERARTFYEHAGFLRLEDHDYRLFIPMRSIARIVQ